MSRRTHEWWFVALGLTLLVLSQTRWGIGAVAWIAPIPLLVALRQRAGWKFRAAFAGLCAVAWSLVSLKIITTPVPPIFSVAFGIPMALFHLPAFFLWDQLVKRGHDGLGVLAFAAATALGEWAQAELTPLGVWGATPTTQIGQTAVLQVLALVGMPGLSFLMNAVAAGVEASLARQLRPAAGWALATTAVAALTWGPVRGVAPMDQSEVRAAMIRTDSTVGGLPIPDAERRQRDTQTLLERTRAAARAGAKLAVWPEGANLVLREEEPALIASASDLARREQLELVVAYIVPLSFEPLKYENRARWFAPDGTERLSYLKHHPVPAEPAVAGPAPAKTVQTSFGPASLAICYDFDFPALGRTHARNGAGLVALPSSDWRGIDPIHAEMAAMRAIEGGYSIVRATRFGLSAGVDTHGRLRGQQSTNESAEPSLMAALPTKPTPTLYTTLGNLVLLPLVAILGWAALVLLGFGLKHRPLSAPPLPA